LVIVATIAYLALVGFATLGPPSIAGAAFSLVYRVVSAVAPVSTADVEFAANILMFLPLGLLFVLVLGPRTWPWALVIGVLVTLGIEGVQAVLPGRVPDVRDLFANASGALVGVVLGAFAVQPRRRGLRAAAVSSVLAGVAIVATVGLVGGSLTPGAPALAATTPVDAQLAYLSKHWSKRNVEQYGSLGDNDCVNFASQSLVVRGWGETDEWWHDSINGVHTYSDAWISSGAMARYFADHPELAMAVDDSERELVALGDIVQFDWDRNGAVDHTGVVNRIDGADIYYASHSNDRESQSVDAAIERDGRGGAISYWHLLQ
jgi:glycopeptide antibiotics resistance protein